MSDAETPKPGTIAWRDLTVPDAKALAGFYRDVVGWETREHDMGAYADYDLIPAGGGDPVAGLCHARGTNADVPPQWLVYVRVEDVAAAAARCADLGGTVLDGPRAMGAMQFCVIRDPVGAVLGLIG